MVKYIQGGAFERRPSDSILDRLLDRGVVGFDAPVEHALTKVKDEVEGPQSMWAFFVGSFVFFIGGTF
jgi:hypothetical protein